MSAMQFQATDKMRDSEKNLQKGKCQKNKITD